MSRFRLTGPLTWYRSLLAEREMLQQKRRDVFRTIKRCLESHCCAIAALGELAFDGPQQVVHFFVVDEQVAVAGHAELPAAFDRHAAEQLVRRRSR